MTQNPKQWKIKKKIVFDSEMQMGHSLCHIEILIVLQRTKQVLGNE